MISKRILEQISNNSEKAFVVNDSGSFSYYDLGEQIKCYNNIFKQYKPKKILIKSNQNFFAYALILAAYLSKVIFCFISETISAEREKIIIEGYKPDILFYSSKFFIEYQNCLELGKLSLPVTCQSQNTINYCAEGNNAYILYTSGTTGTPKGCIVRRESLELLIDKSSEIFNLTPNDIYGQYAPLYFDMSMLDIFLATTNGLTIVPFASQLDKLKPARLIKKYRVTFFNSVPHAISLIERNHQLNLEFCSSLRQIKLGGDKVRKELVENIFNSTEIQRLYVTYGPTEATVFCMVTVLERNGWEHEVDNIVALGHGISGYSDITIENDEIIVSGPCVTSGYLNSPSDNFYKINNIRHYRTGDFCLLKNGKMFFIGRKDRQMKINGNRIDMSEVENALAGFCNFVRCVNYHNRIIAFVMSKESKENIKKRLIVTLPPYMIPSEIIFISAVPLLGNGKIDENKLIKILEN